MADVRVVLTTTFLLSCVLCACGGGGTGDSAAPSGGEDPSATAAGQYASTTDAAELYLMPDGSFYLLNMGPAGGYAVVGVGTGTPTTYAGTGTQFIYAGSRYVVALEVSGTYTHQSSIDLSFGQYEFTGTFVPEFFNPAKQSDVAGTFANGAGLPAMTVDPDGNLVIDSFLIAPCLITGTIRPHGGTRVYDAELNFQPSSQCSARSYKGIAILNGKSLGFLMKEGYFLHVTKL